jgi:pimeloyl-ACP methyl ester carboxylesterase
MSFLRQLWVPTSTQQLLESQSNLLSHFVKHQIISNRFVLPSSKHIINYIASTPRIPSTSNLSPPAAVSNSSPIISATHSTQSVSRTSHAIAAGAGAGAGEGDSVLNVVFAHGFGSGLGFFFRNYDAFSTHSSSSLRMNAYGFDWLGMGGSSRPPCHQAPRLPLFSFRPNANRNSSGHDNSTSSNQSNIVGRSRLNSISGPSSTGSATSGLAETLATPPTQPAPSGISSLLQTIPSMLPSLASSTLTPAQATDFFIDSFDEWVREMGLDKKPFVLVGHSLGGYLSARYALKYPSRLKGLVLASPVRYLFLEYYIYCLVIFECLLPFQTTRLNPQFFNCKYCDQRHNHSGVSLDNYIFPNFHSLRRLGCRRFQCTRTLFHPTKCPGGFD